MGRRKVMKLLDKLEDFILTELESDYIMRAFLLLVVVCIINAVIFGISLIGSYIIVTLIGLYGLYVGSSVIVILRSNYKKSKKGWD